MNTPQRFDNDLNLAVKPFGKLFGNVLLIQLIYELKSRR
ncbi:MAG: hypothetical protein ACI8P9_004517 [Parasphingorhabdus sp.]|jgi:hypothetical protein